MIKIQKCENLVFYFIFFTSLFCCFASCSKAEIKWRFETSAEPDRVLPSSQLRAVSSASDTAMTNENDEQNPGTNDFVPVNRNDNPWFVGFSNSKKILNFEGPNKAESGELLISPMGGNLSLSGTEQHLEIGKQMGAFDLVLGLARANASGTFVGDMSGNQAASFDRLSFNTDVHVKQDIVSLGMVLPSTNARTTGVTEKYQVLNTKSKIRVSNRNNIDWINLNNQVAYNHDQIQIGHELKHNWLINNKSSFSINSAFAFGLKEKTSTGINANSFGLGLGFKTKFKADKIYEEPISISKPRQGFFEAGIAKGLASSAGTAKLSEDDYSGTILFSDILGMNGEEVTIRSSLGRCYFSCWTVSYSKSQKNVHFGTETIDTILGPANLTSSFLGKLDLHSIGINRHFQGKKHKAMQSFRYLGANFSTGSVRQISSSSYKGRERISSKNNDIILGGLTIGLGLRRFLQGSTYFFSEHSLNYYDGGPFGTPLVIKEAFFKTGIGKSF